VRRLFENLKKLSKITEFEFQNSGPSFFASVSPMYCKKLDSIRTKLTEEIHFEVCPYGDSGHCWVSNTIFKLWSFHIMLTLFEDYIITFCVSRRRRKMYCGHARCLSAAVRPHHCTDPDVTWGVVEAAP